MQSASSRRVSSGRRAEHLARTAGESVPRAQTRGASRRGSANRVKGERRPRAARSWQDETLKEAHKVAHFCMGPEILLDEDYAGSARQGGGQSDKARAVLEGIARKSAAFLAGAGSSPRRHGGAE